MTGLTHRLSYASLISIVVCCAAHAAAQPTSSPAAPVRDLQSARLDFRAVVQAAKDQVYPAVVYVKVLQENNESGKKETIEVAGSGVIISAKGEMLTNWHVVDKCTEIRCLLYDGRNFDGKLIGTDKDADLALVQLKLPENAAPVPTARLGDSRKLKEGDFVMAMGAPWGLDRSVSIGIVSCTRRYLPEHSEYGLWLQTDASICPGNSGGPLVNTDGEVIGINTLGMTGEMGFAIPSEMIRQVVSQLRESGKMNWSWTGLQLQPLRDFQRNVYFEGTEGLIVAETDPESPARQCGIQRSDRILSVNGQKVSAITEEDLPGIRMRLGLLEKHKPAEIVLLRGGQRQTVQLTLREKGKVEGEELDCPRWDMTIKTINQFDNPDLFFHRQVGVFIYGVKYPGNAAAAELQSQDILLQIDGKDVTTLQQVKELHAKALENVEKNHRVKFSVLRNGLMRQIVVDFSRDYEKE